MHLALGLFGREAFWDYKALLGLEVPATLHFPVGFSPLPYCNLAEFLPIPLPAACPGAGRAQGSGHLWGQKVIKAQGVV